MKTITGTWAGDSLRSRFFRGAVWSVIATALSQGMAFVSYAVAARVLTKTGFGELGMIQSTVGMFGVFAGVGLGLTATKHVAEYRVSKPARAGRVIGVTVLVAVVMGGIGATILALFSPYLAAQTLNAPHLVVELRIGCALLLLNTIDGVQAGALAGFEAFSAIARTNFFRGIANLTLVASGVYYWGLRGALCGLAGAAAVGLVSNHLAIRSQAAQFGISITHRSFRSELPTLWSYSVPAFLSGALVTPAGWLVRTLLVNQPGGYAEMAVFTVASRVQDVINLAGQTVGAALLPMLASERGLKSERLSQGNILLSWVIGTALVLPLICFPEIVGGFFGSQYATRGAVQTMVLVLVSTAVVMYKQGLARVLAANSLMWWGALSNFTWATTLVVVSWGLVHSGAPGLAAAVLIAYVLNTIVFMPLYLRKRLAPRALLASPTALLIWATVLTAATLSYFGAPAVSRCLVGGVSMLVVFTGFLRLQAGKTQELPEKVIS